VSEANAPELSVCIPLYNEEAVAPELIRRVREAVGGAGPDWELVLVDDGSDDRTWEIVREQSGKDPRVRGVRLSRNFGLQAAVTCALRSARGRAVVLMDGDLQDPPEMIPEMVERWREGAEVVYTVKTERDERPLRKLCFSLFHRLFRWLAGPEMVPGAGLFSLMNRRALDALLSFSERHRYMPGLRFWIGFRQESVEFRRPARAAGSPKQTFRRLVRLALDGILSFSKLPLRLAAVLGLAVAGVAFGVMLFGLVMKVLSWISGEQSLAIPGWASTLTAVTFLGGVQLLFMGVIGEYLGRIYDEVKGRPIYLVAEETPVRE
jgi:dolichol-phosphate mannosyltransferase